MMYNQTILDHFKNPRNSGELPEASATVDVTNPVCGDVLRLAVRIEGGRISAARFKTQGCVAAIAACSALTEMMVGRRLDELAAITPQQIAEALGGLPPASFHGAQLAADAIPALARLLARDG
jgi:nitrogen fixation protein NifU and related proteins